MTLADYTAAILCAVTLLLILWDVYVKVEDKSGDSTISWIMRCAATRWPIIACAVGVVIGHFWWPNCPICH